MFQTYDEVYEWIHSHIKFGIKPGLERMEWMLGKLRNPEKSLKAIHVGGTNGKGSTVTYIQSILKAAGYQIGTFTSPAIEHFNERISVNGSPITDQEMIEVASTMQPITKEMEDLEIGPPTEFEIITTMAIYYFSKVNPVDLAIIEVGLGGRYDSTNVIQPLLSIITNIGYDHTQILGDTIEQIAFEKAGIIKEKTLIITAEQSAEALHVIHQEASRKQAPLLRCGKDFFVTNEESIQQGERFTYEDEQHTYDQLTVRLIGKHQTVNAACALTAIHELRTNFSFQVNEIQIRNGFMAASWPGRFELLQRTPPIIIDGAHNPEGLHAFIQSISSRYAQKKIKIVFAALEDKDIFQMVQILQKAPCELYLTEFDHPRAAAIDQLTELGHSNIQLSTDWKLLLSQLVSTMRDEEVLAITGSLYFIAQVKPFLLQFIDKK